MAKAKTSAKQSKPTPSNVNPDAELIRLCVSHAQNAGAFSAGFNVDPTGNADFCAANTGGRRFERAAQRTIQAASAIPATTAAGINAKARVIIADQGPRRPDYISAIDNGAFFLSFANDVKNFTADLLENKKTKVGISADAIGAALGLAAAKLLKEAEAA